MSFKVDISIVIINYNTFELTCQCIQSVIEKSQGSVCEIILVDNASTERPPQGFKEKFPQIKLVENSINVGFAKGNNLGISIAKGEYILLLNSDTLLRNDVPTILQQFLVRHPQVAAVSGRLEYADGTVQHNCQRFPSIRYQLYELFRLQKLMPKKWGGKILFGAFFAHDSVAYPDWIWGTCFMFRKKLLGRLHNRKLADDLFMYGEDMQWCLEFRNIGYQVAFEPAAIVVHLMGKSGAKKNDLMEQNENWLMNKYYSKIEMKIINSLNRLLHVGR